MSELSELSKPHPRSGPKIMVTAQSYGWKIQVGYRMDGSFVTCNTAVAETEKEVRTRSRQLKQWYTLYVERINRQESLQEEVND